MARAIAVFLAGLSVCPATALAAAQSLTIYNDDLALVRDLRDMTLQAGQNKVEFPGVAAQIIPESVVLKTDGLSVIEQTFDSDLLTPVRILEKMVGQEVEIIRTNPGSGAEQRERATVLGATNGITLRIGDRIELFPQDTPLPRIRLDKLPDNLRSSPALSMLLDAKSGGKRTLEINYLTRGLSWQADYVLLLDDKQQSASVKGWITLRNSSGMSYQNIKADLVAGSINRSAPRPMAAPRYDMSMAKAESREPLGDYTLYSLPGTTSIADNQTKQVSFLDAPKVRAVKRYHYESYGFASQRQAEHVDVGLIITNSKASGLGEPLPAGVIRIYGEDQAGQARFLGEDRIGHTPEGLEIRPDMGKAFDVTVQSTITARREYKKDRYENSMAYKFRNARSEPVTVMFRQSGLGDNWDIISESKPHQSPDAQSAEWTVIIPANGEQQVTFTVRQKE